MLYVGDDWAEDHHDVEVMDQSGRTVGKAKLPEGVAGIARLHAMIGKHLGEDAESAQVTIGIEIDRGPWVRALVAAGYTVIGVNPLQAARYRERLAVSGAKSDPADAHMLADMVRTDAHQLRPVALDSDQAEAVKVVARMHKTLIWERTRTTQRLRHALREYFPAAVEAFEDLDAADTLELLAKAPDPAKAARLSLGQISAALKRARRRDIPTKAAAIQAVLRAPRRCPDDPGVRRPASLPGRQGLLRPPTRPRQRAQRRPTPTGQPPRRHPARLPQDPQPLQRGHCLVAPSQPDCCLNIQAPGTVQT